MTHLFKVKTNLGWRFACLETLPRSCGCDGSLEEWLLDELERGGAESLQIETIRELTTHRNVGVETLTIFHSGQRYGGPEEGGWWYDEHTVVRTITVSSKNVHRHLARLQRYCEALNKDLPNWDRENRFHVTRGELPKRTERPHYCREATLRGGLSPACPCGTVALQRKQTRSHHDA